MPSVAQIQAICGRHKSNRLYVAPIPTLQLNNARVALGIPPSDDVIGLANMTVFGSCKYAIAFCSSGIYIKNIGTARDYLTWDEFQVLRFEHVYGFLTYKIRFSDGRLWDITGDNAFRGVIPLVFQSLLDIAIEPRATVTASEWHVAVHQQQFGPYDTETLKSLVASGQIDSSSALVWRDGMANWSPFTDVHELKAFPKLPSVAPPIPSQPSSSSPIVAPKPFLAEAVGSPLIARQSTITENGPMVDINNAPLDDLLYLPGLALASARQLIQERQFRLGFQTIEEVGELLDLPPHKVQRLRERVRIEPFSGTGHATSARRRVVDF